jgi:hypothetical protein
MSERGARFLPGNVIVGNAIYHTVGDRKVAVEQLALDYDHAYAELGQLVGVLPYEGSGERVKQHPDWFVWWNAAAAPLFTAWAAFKRDQIDSGDRTGGDWIAYANRWKTDYPVYESWRRRLADLRASAQRMGMRLHTADPAELPSTIAEDVESGAKKIAAKAGDAVDVLGTILKVALWGGVGLGTLYIGAEIYKGVRK